ncbi:MAG: sugar nucleotide-binding protein [Candidatus Micrarchaeota archaeon]
MKNEKMKRIIILGSSGLLGSCLYHLAKQKNINVLGVSRTKSETTDIVCDCTNKESIDSIIKKEGCDVIINTIKFKGSTDECEIKKEQCWQCNVVVPSHLSALQKKYGYLLVQISTDWIFEGNENVVYNTNSLPYPRNFYAFSKFVAETEVMKARRFLIIRTTGLFGFEKPPRNFFAKVLDAAENNRQIDATSDQYSQPISALELSDIIYTLLKKKKDILNKTLHIVGSDYVSRYEFAQRIISCFGLDMNLVRNVTTSSRMIYVPKYLKLDINETECIIERNIPSLDSMILRLKEFERERYTNPPEIKD